MICVNDFSVFGIVATSLLIREESVFRADHPFIFFLKEGNNYLFEGVFHS